MEEWLWDESNQAGTDYLDEEMVRGYDRIMQTLRDIPAEIQVAATAIGVTPGMKVWESGTGTGEMALGLAACGAQVWATDISPAMLGFARKKAAERGLPAVKFGQGGFLSGFAPETPVDAVVSQLALHHLPDFWKQMAVRRMAQHLRGGGLLFLRDVVIPDGIGDYGAYFTGVVDGLRQSAGEEMAKRTARHFRQEFSTLDWVLEGMFNRAGLRVQAKDSDGFLTAYTCVREQ